ncbi:MAG: aldehyde dehydrogenase family protein [Gammaproteobacteria bacterium PRO9]|nr:aldehyde dehydrogenase family protein [Gammaproteobacteria bacterium PRO9]
MTTGKLRRLPIRNPRTGLMDYEIEAADAAELARVAARLRAGQVQWAAAGVARRLEVLKAWTAHLSANAGPLIEALSTDTGRHLVAASEIQAVVGMVAGNAVLAPRVLPSAGQAAGERASATAGIGIQTQFVPYGLVGVISPWNFPLLLSMLDTISALVAGCAVLVKPSEVTPRFVAPLMASLDGFPELKAVLAFATGDGRTGAALIDQVDAICFTGSVPTGRKVGEACAARFIPAFLELGGKDPVIVLESADPDRAASIVLRASCQATGHACQSLERVYVDSRIAPKFIESLVRQAEAVKLNFPDSHRGQIGPLIFERQADIIAGQLEDAVAKGARIMTGGQIEHHGGGLWLRPTVVTGVNHDMTLMTEETFGPVVPVIVSRDTDEAVRLANDSIYGLSAAVIGEEQAALAVARRLNVGAVSINDGGLTTVVFDAEKNAFKLSGLGASRMGPSGLLRFLRQKALLIQRGRAKDMSDLEEARGAQP